MTTIASLYADGGVVGSNPSLIGGTWAWCSVGADDTFVTCGSGLVTPHEIGMQVVTNNVTELLALLNARASQPWDWKGAIYSDSWVTLQRVFLTAALNGVPDVLVRRLQSMQRQGWFQGCSYQLLDGHPTSAQLAAGVGKRGRQVSRYNVWCDQACGRIAKETLRAQRV